MNRAPIAAFSLMTRLRAHLGLKLALACGLNVFAFVPYFWLQRHVFFPVTVMPQSAVDVWIGFGEQVLWLYLSLFLLLPIAPMQMQTRNQIWRYTLGVAAMSLIADLIFLFRPTAVVRPAGREASVIYRSLVSLDMPLNAFPSLHAAMAVFSACCCEQISSECRQRATFRALVWIWVAGMIYAMLLVKQHVLLDVAAGVVLGLASYYLAFSKSQREREPIVIENQMIKREGSSL